MHHAEMSNTDLIWAVWLPLLLVIAGYFLPSIIAFARGHWRRWTVLFLNAVLGRVDGFEQD